MHTCPRIFVLALCFSLIAQAELVRVELTERSVVLSGRLFGQTGAYERLRGTAHFAVDPSAPANGRVVDITKAPRNAAGLVEFSADLYVLKPVDSSKGNRTVLFEASNRGGKGMLGLFNRAASSLNPSTSEHFGDGLLMEEGYTLVWLGWQHDAPVRPDAMRFNAPVATGVPGLVRSEFTPDKPITRFSLGDANHIPYPVTDPSKVTLTVRDGTRGTRQKLDARLWAIDKGTEVVLSEPATPGRTYEVVYESRDPAVAGLGLAAVRDFISFLKYGGKAESSLNEKHQHAIGFGNSQSAMMMKALLYEGFNADERGRRVFDGIFSDVAGARRATFHRFTQLSRTAGPLRNASFSTTDQFPFAEITTSDRESGLSDGLLARARQSRTVPKIIHTNSSYEYWGSSSALLHTSLDGKHDLALPPTSRLYMLTGGQHGPAPLGTPATRSQNLPNFSDHKWIHRALLRRLYEWVANGKVPPPSAYPTIAANTLVSVGEYTFPQIPNIAIPRLLHINERLDFGPMYRKSGAITVEPPRAGKPYTILIPQADADGIDIAGVKMPWISVPIGTFTGWNLRSPAIGSSDELLSQVGSFIPFPLTKEARNKANDPRASLEERYATQAEYLRRIQEAGLALSKSGLLLERDIPAIVSIAQRYWEFTTSEALTSSVKPQR